MLLPAGDLVALLKTVVDTPSVSGDEGRLADAVEAVLRAASHLQVGRQGNTIWARTELGRASRVIIAGHLDTVPLAGNLPSRLVDGPDGQPMLWGRGTVDMKGGIAVMLHVATAVTAPSRDVTWIFYDCEEVEAARNGLGRLAAAHPELLSGDLAVLMEPTNGLVEGGCQGTLRFAVTTRGVAAHSARGWLGSNAIHAAAPVLARVVEVQPMFGEVEVDGLTYREGLNITMIDGGVAGNVIPDRCVVQVNYRFAPSVGVAAAEAKMRSLFDGLGDFELLDASPGARPGLDRPVGQAFVSVVGVAVGPKYGWTDVARFSALGVPAVNYGPGDPSLCHADNEAIPLAQVQTCALALARWLAV